MKSSQKFVDRDKGDPFFSDEAIRNWKQRIKELEAEERSLSLENRKRYEENKKKKDKSREEGPQQSLKRMETESFAEGRAQVRVVRHRGKRTKRTSHNKPKV